MDSEVGPADPPAENANWRHRSENMDDKVSDIVSVGLINSDEVDDLLSQGEDDLDDLDGKDNEVILANRQCNLSTDVILACEFREAPRPSLPPVSEKLVTAVTNWMQNTPKREKNLGNVWRGAGTREY